MPPTATMIRPVGPITTTARSIPTPPGSTVLPAQPTRLAPLVSSAAAKQNQPKSLLGQLGQLVTGIPQGVAHFVKDIATDVAVVPHLAVNLATGHAPHSLSDFASSYFPAATGVVKSLGHTAGDIIHPTHFIQAAQQGHILGKIAEDVGNVALVGGPVAKLIGAGGAAGAAAAEAAGAAADTTATVGKAAATEAGQQLAKEGALETTLPASLQPAGYRGLAKVAANAGNDSLAQALQHVGNVVQTVTHVGEQAANVPALPYQWAGRGLLKAGEALGLERPSAYLQQIGERVAPGITFQLSQEGGVLRSIKALAGGTRTKLQREAYEPALLGRNLGLTPAEGEAVINSIRSPFLGEQFGRVTNDAELQQLLDHPTAWGNLPQELRPTVEGIRTLDQFQKGTLPADRMAAMNQVRDAIVGVAQKRQERALGPVGAKMEIGTPAEPTPPGTTPAYQREQGVAPGGTPTGVGEYPSGLNPEQLGTDLLSQRVQEFIDPHMAAVNRLQRGLEPLANRAARAQRMSDAADAIAEARIPAAQGVQNPAILAEAGRMADQLNTALEEYNRLIEAGAPEEQIATAGAAVDQLTAEARQLQGAGWRRYQGSRVVARDELGNVTERAPTYPPSRFERERMNQGVLNDRARATQLSVDRVQRSIQNHLDAVANARDTLSQSVQDRLHQNLNIPTVNSLTSVIKRLGPQDAAVRDGLLEDINRVMQGETDAGLRLNSPQRVMDVINQSSHLLPAETQNRLQSVMDRYNVRRVNMLSDTASAQMMAAPAPIRAAMQDGQRQVATLLQRGEEMNAAHPGSGDQYIRMAEDTMTELQKFVDAGHTPVKLVGGITPTGAGGGGSYPGAGLTVPSLRSQKAARTGLGTLNLDAYARLEAQQAGRWVTGRQTEAVAQMLGQRADSLPGVQEAMAAHADAHNGEQITPDVLKQALKDNGYAGLNPNEALSPGSTVVPQRVFESLNPKEYNIPGLRALGKSNQMFKTWVLPFSPRWHVGNVLGNALMAGFHAGVSPLELANNIRKIVKTEGGWRNVWANEGLVGGLPAELAQGGFTHEEYQLMRDAAEKKELTGPVGRGINRVAAGSYKLNSMIDNLTRSSTYLAKLAGGETTDQALQSTLRSMGDYAHMSNFERNVVKQVFPFYAWLRHSIGATMALPIQSPARAAFLLHLSDMYNDPNEKPGLLQMMGSRIPIAGGLLNVGGASPFGDVSPFGFALDPTNIGQNLAPALKVASTVGLGLDPSKRFKPVTRPGGTSGKDMFGLPTVTSPLERVFADPLHGLGEIGWQLTKQGPGQIRALRDYLLGPEVRYSGTGYQIRNKTDQSKRSIGQILKMLNIPTIDKMPTGGAA